MAQNLRVKATIEAEDRASGNINKVQKSFSGLTDFIATRFVVTLGDLGRIASSAFGALEDAAKLQATRRALRSQVDDLDAFLTKLKEVSKGTVATSDLIESSSRALLLGIPADKISALLETARTSAAATGQSVSQAFQDITTGIGRASPLILDNLGFVVRLEDTYQKFAGTLGKTTETLTDAERKQALLNEVLEQGAQRGKEFGDAFDGVPEKLDQTKTKIVELTDALKNLLLVGTGEAITFLERTATKLEQLFNRDPILQYIEAQRELREQIDFVNSATENQVTVVSEVVELHDAQAKAIERVAALKERETRITGELAQQEKELAEALKEAGITLQDTNAEIEKQVRAITLLEQAQRANGDATGDYARAIEEAKDKLAELRGETTATAAATDASTGSYERAATAVTRLATSTREATTAQKEFQAVQREGVGSGSIGQGAILPGISIAELVRLQGTPGNTIPFNNQGAFIQAGSDGTRISGVANVRGNNRFTIRPDGTRVVL